MWNGDGQMYDSYKCGMGMARCMILTSVEWDGQVCDSYRCGMGMARCMILTDVE